MEYDQSDKDIMNIIHNNYRLYNSNKKCILVSSVDTPYIGGSSTNAYRIIKHLRSDTNYEVIGLFIDGTNNKEDPDKLGKIIKLNPSQENLTDEYLSTVKDKLLSLTTTQKIDVVFAKNYKSVILTRKMFPESKIIFSPSGSRFYTLYCDGINKFVSYNEMYGNINEYTIDPKMFNLKEGS